MSYVTNVKASEKQVRYLLSPKYIIHSRKYLKSAINSLYPWEKAGGFETVWRGTTENLRHLEGFTQKCKLWIIGHSKLHWWSFLACSSESGFLFPHWKSCSVAYLQDNYHSQLFLEQSKVLLILKRYSIKWNSRNFLFGHVS